MFGELLKAAVGVVVETPVSLVADVVTLGGTLSDKREDTPYTYDALAKVVDNIQKATK